MPANLLRIATRESPLALWQANHIRKCLQKHWPELRIELLPMNTTGDRFLKNKLQVIGGKGLFVKELEEALFDKRADIAVHSMKDVPSIFPEHLELNTICMRDNPFDALVSSHFLSLNALPEGARIGTSSQRREAQLRAARPDLIIKPIRGNVGTRLSKLDKGEFDALILAAAGLQRLNLHHRIQETLNENLMLPACGQGALGIECRIDDSRIKRLLKPLHAPADALCVQTERSVNMLLGGNCHTPVAIYCRIESNDQLILKAKVASLDGLVVIEDIQQGAREQAQLLAKQCAESLINQGANALLHHE